MKYIPLIFAGLFRKPVRSLLTFLSVVIAFILFGALSSLEAGFADTIGKARLDRLFVDPRFGTPMPLTYAEQIARIPGVVVVAPRMGMFGYFRDPKNSLGVVAADERFFAAKPELQMGPRQLQTWERSNTGAIISTNTAKKFGWKVGDKIPITGGIAMQNGSRVWTFDVVSLVTDSDFPEVASYFVVHYKYLDEARAYGKGTINRLIVRIRDPNQSVAISGTIDRLFANSSAPTRTSSEKSSVQANLQSFGDIKYFTRAIISAVLFMMLFLTGNTMMQSVRERTSEFAVMKTLGFSDTAVLYLVFFETLVLCVFAGITGLLLVKMLIVPLVHNSSPTVGGLFLMSWSVISTGLIFSLLVAFASGLAPALRVRRLSIVEALART